MNAERMIRWLAALLAGGPTARRESTPHLAAHRVALGLFPTLRPNASPVRDARAQSAS
ncbi:MAG TPA: hypothetical protein VHA82_14805 [Ramlibacter sp.]|uniref:hypothetical protein n=1 Tax=Ramlibacter sp. TaxID=1917967 RepID=UPI002CE53F64|nr:hypothetical protein [Ramlibacter sp.]HVZ45078.1 hypothetical protein [Ramlibacter sp.]